MAELKTESQHQANVIKWFWEAYVPFRGLLYHNYTNPRSQVGGAQLKALGLMKGTPDLTLAIPRGGFGAFYLEMKKPGEKPEEHQFKQMDRLRAAGNCVDWADNAESAKEKIINYLSL